jgi:hypothetical protein
MRIVIALLIVIILLLGWLLLARDQGDGSASSILSSKPAIEWEPFKMFRLSPSPFKETTHTYDNNGEQTGTIR